MNQTVFGNRNESKMKDKNLNEHRNDLRNPEINTDTNLEKTKNSKMKYHNEPKEPK